MLSSIKILTLYLYLNSIYEKFTAFNTTLAEVVHSVTLEGFCVGTGNLWHVAVRHPIVRYGLFVISYVTYHYSQDIYINRKSEDASRILVIICHHIW